MSINKYMPYNISTANIFSLSFSYFHLNVKILNIFFLTELFPRLSVSHMQDINSYNEIMGNRAFADLRYGKKYSISLGTTFFAATKG